MAGGVPWWLGREGGRNFQALKLEPHRGNGSPNWGHVILKEGKQLKGKGIKNCHVTEIKRWQIKLQEMILRNLRFP